MEVSPLSFDRLVKTPVTTHFIPSDLSLQLSGFSSDVFSFGCVICHLITQQLPTLSSTKFKDSVTGKLVVLSRSEGERCSKYINQISDGSLKELVITCLDDDPKGRPTISVVSERITSIITG